jgi:hypothetical protein
VTGSKSKLEIVPGGIDPLSAAVSAVWFVVTGDAAPMYLRDTGLS